MKCIFPKSEARISVLTTSVQCCTGGSQCNKGRKRNKNHKHGKRRSKDISVPGGHVHVENPKESSKQLLELIREFSEVTGIKVNILDTPKCPNICGSKLQAIHRVSRWSWDSGPDVTSTSVSSSSQAG